MQQKSIKLKLNSDKGNKANTNNKINTKLEKQIKSNKCYKLRKGEIILKGKNWKKIKSQFNKYV